jgi:predicted TIM-barrel fold metal-dependent hydrolase
MRQLPFLQPYMAKEFMYDINNRGGKTGGHNIAKTVYLECGWHTPSVEEALKPVGEVNMVLSVNKQHPNICQGIVAHANLSLPDVAKTLDAYAKLPPVKGIRCNIAQTDDVAITSPEPKDLARSDEFKRGFGLLHKYGFTFDTWMYHEQIPALIDLVTEFPDTVVIADHVALPLGIGSYKAEETFPTWEQGMRQLARASRNVYVKLSGLGMCQPGFRFDEKDKPPSSAELAEAWAPYFKVCIDAFGIDRCIFASNFPVDKTSCDYTILWNAFKLFAQNFSAADKRKLFYENARRVYRL